MKVFIGWSGPQSKYIALALRGWLCDVIQNLTPWMSEVDTPAGECWGKELRKELQDSHFGVVCLTAENLGSPWLHYEAGALAKTGEVLVCPYLYKIEPSAVKEPLSYHQAKQVNKQGTKELLHSINAASLDLTQRGIRPQDFDRVFETWWPQLERKLNNVPPSITAPPPRDILQEEATRIKEERKRRVLEILAERERTVPPIDSDIENNVVDVLKKRATDRSAFPNLEAFLSGKPPPPSDTPQKGKPSSK